MARDDRDDRDAMDRLDRFLDHLADRTPLPLSEPELDPEMADALQRFQAQGDRPHPNPQFVAHLEKKIMDAVIPAGVPSPIPPLTHEQNGRVAGRRFAWVSPTPTRPKRTSRFERLSSVALFVVVLLMAAVVL